MDNRSKTDWSNDSWRMAGAPLEKAEKAVVLLHGRGSSGDDIIRLGSAIPDDNTCYIAPSAAAGSWYPNRFLAPLESNEPDLSQSLDTIASVVEGLVGMGIPLSRIGLAGFSQGACLALEHVSTKGLGLGFAAALSGALVGPLDRQRPSSDLAGIPCLIACAERDSHIPLEHVKLSAELFRQRGAKVTEIVFQGGGHTVFAEEIDWLTKAVKAL